MNLFGLNRRRSETLLLALGQLVLIAYIFQVAALDHWHTNPARDVTGIVGTSAHEAVHAAHCHGGPSSCADAAAGFAQLSTDVVRLPSPNPPLVLAADASVPTPQDAYPNLIPEPPRSLA